MKYPIPVAEEGEKRLCMHSLFTRLKRTLEEQVNRRKGQNLKPMKKKTF